MIVIRRGLARAFRALARKCLTGRPRAPAPAVGLEARAGTLTARAAAGDAMLVYAAPAPGGGGALVVPMAVLGAVEGPGDDPVELAARPGHRGEARWADRGGPRTHPFDADPPAGHHPPPDPPADWRPVPAGLLAALHACGRTTARDAGRYALDRVRVRGAAGEVVGTDGRTALVWGGWSFPFGEDLLVPAVPVFGAREMACGGDVRVGLAADALVVGAGPWRVHLPVDRAGRYPDLTAVLRRDGPSVARLDARDAAELLARLPALPGADAEYRPVTLALDGCVSVSARDGATGAAGHVRLARSTAAGPPRRVGVDRRAVARALALGCVSVRAGEGRPVVFEGPDRALVAVALDPAPAAGASPDETPRAEGPHDTERRTTVRHETNAAGPTGPPDQPPGDPPDPLAAAEDLRAALADAGVKAGRLVAALKARLREKKALSQVWAGLRQLNLGPGGPP